MFKRTYADTAFIRLLYNILDIISDHFFLIRRHESMFSGQTGKNCSVVSKTLNRKQMQNNNRQNANNKMKTNRNIEGYTKMTIYIKINC